MSQPEKLRVRAEDGAESEATLFAPDGAPPADGDAVVVCLPAMGTPARFYEPLARQLAARGLRAVTAELRGIGSSSVRARRGVDFGYHELVARDLPALLASVARACPAAPVFLLGHSLGGHLSTMYASAHPGAVRGIVLVASGTPFHASWPFPGNAALYALALFARATSRALGYFPGRRVGFGGTEARRLMHEWAGVVTSGRFAVGGSPHDFEALLPTLALPVLALSLAGDRFAPRRATEHLLAKLPRAAVTRQHLGPGDLDARALDHFRWAKQPAPIAEIVARWVREHARGGAPAAEGR